MIPRLHLAVATLLWLLMSAYHLQAQCPSGNVNFYSQSDVDAFVISYPSCTVIGGNLHIGANPSAPSPTDINDLSSLNITLVNGSVNIVNNPNLADLNGLDMIATINGRLDITDNDGLIEIDEFNNIFVGLHVTVSGNDALNLVSGFNNLESMRRLAIFENATLNSITGLSDLDLFLDLNIQDNPLLSNISGFTYTNLAGMNINDNASLAICNTLGICTALTAGIPSSISGNDTGCESNFVVESECLFGLPVEIVHLNLEQKGLDHLLTWTTASEQNNLGFSVEHSYDGQVWRSLTFVEGKINSHTRQNYSFVHEQAGAGMHYYRLKQVDTDGRFTYSELLQNFISIGTDYTHIKSYPNPSDGEVTLVISNPRADKARLTVSSIEGIIIFEKTFAAGEAGEVWTKNFQDLPVGMYIVSMQQGTSFSWSKFQVMNKN